MSQDSKFLCLMYPSPFVGWAWICGDGSDSNPDREEVAKLIDNADGKLIPAAYERTAQALLDQKIISKPAEGGFTTAITDKAIK